MKTLAMALLTIAWMYFPEFSKSYEREKEGTLYSTVLFILFVLLLLTLIITP